MLLRITHVEYLNPRSECRISYDTRRRFATLACVCWAAISLARSHDARHVQAQVGQQFAPLAMFDESVGHAQPADVAAC